MNSSLNTDVIRLRVKENVWVNLLNVGFPEFRKYDPKSWFLQVEKHFQKRKVITDMAKYYAVIAALDIDILQRIFRNVETSSTAISKYSDLKESLIKAYTNSSEFYVLKLFEKLDIANKKSFKLYETLESFNIVDDILHIKWLAVFPNKVIKILKFIEGATAKELFYAGDVLMRDNVSSFFLNNSSNCLLPAINRQNKYDYIITIRQAFINKVLHTELTLTLRDLLVDLDWVLLGLTAINMNGSFTFYDDDRGPCISISFITKETNFHITNFQILNKISPTYFKYDCIDRLAKEPFLSKKYIQSAPCNAWFIGEFSRIDFLETMLENSICFNRLMDFTRVVTLGINTIIKVCDKVISYSPSKQLWYKMRYHWWTKKYDKLYKVSRMVRYLHKIEHKNGSILEESKVCMRENKKILHQYVKSTKIELWSKLICKEEEKSLRLPYKIKLSDGGTYGQITFNMDRNMFINIMKILLPTVYT